MSPELFYPENFDLTDSRPTKQSDCYALGMVTYEVLSGQVPFPHYNAYAIVAKVSRGERPGRPRGAQGKWFTDDVWRTLERCWAPERERRPRIEDVLRCLEKASPLWTPLSPGIVADPHTINSSVWKTLDPDTEESTEDSEASSLSTIYPDLPPKPANFPAHGIMGRCGGTGPHRGDVPRGHTQPTLPRQSGSSAQNPPATGRSPGISSTVAEPPTPFPRYNTDSSSSASSPVIVPLPNVTPPAPLFTRPEPTTFPAPTTSGQGGGDKSHRSGLPRYQIQPTPWKNHPLLQPPSTTSPGMSSTIAEPSYSPRESNTDSPPSSIHPVIPFIPSEASSITEFVTSEQRGGRKWYRRIISPFISPKPTGAQAPATPRQRRGWKAHRNIPLHFRRRRIAIARYRVPPRDRTRFTFPWQRNSPRHGRSDGRSTARRWKNWLLISLRKLTGTTTPPGPHTTYNVSGVPLPRPRTMSLTESDTYL